MFAHLVSHRSKPGQEQPLLDFEAGYVLGALAQASLGALEGAIFVAGACGGAPILADSLGVFECERFAVYDGGDHHILVGEVVKASFDSSMDPLLYFRGRYRRLHFD